MLPRKTLTAPALALVLALGGCRQDMHDQPVAEPYEASDFFADGRSDRLPIDGTVARGFLRADVSFYTGLAGDQFVTDLPLSTSKALLERGRDRFEIFCSPCHDRLGQGRGMIVRRGFKQPASFHEPRLRAQPVGYFFDVMSSGFGEMSSYAAQIKAEDRWAIAAYIRALQLSQRVVLDDLPASVANEIAVASDEAPDGSSKNLEPHQETPDHD